MGARNADDSYDRLRRRVLWRLTTGLYVIGSADGGTRNLMTANLVMQLSMEPKVVGVGIENGALTHALVRASGAFSVSMLDREDRAIVRHFVKPVVDDPEAGTLGGHAVHAGATGAPILDMAIAYLDCRVTETLDFASHTLFAGEVVDAGFQGAGEESLSLRMEDTRMHYGG